jgi:hypothetical protein
VSIVFDDHIGELGDWLAGVGTRGSLKRARTPALEVRGLA